MNAAIELMREAESFGAAVDISGDQLILVRGKLLPTLLLEKMRSAKPAIIEIMERDRKAKETGFLALHSGEVYEWQISDNSHVFVIQNESGKWDAWRETWNGRSQTGSTAPKAISSKEIVSNGSFDMALLKAKHYIETLAGWKG
jgi:hypothetical protein